MVLAGVDVINIKEVVPITKQLIFSMYIDTEKISSYVNLNKSRYVPICPSDKLSESKFTVLIIGARKLGKVLNGKNNFW